MSEEEYIALVLRIQTAMAVEPFMPSLEDVAKLLIDWRTLRRLIDKHNDECRECPVIELDQPGHG